MKIGRIYGEIVDRKFTFATKEYFSGDFVKIVEDEGRKDSAEMVCEIIGRGVSNKYLTTPEIVKYLDDNMDFQRDTLYTYTVIYMGVIKNGKISKDKVNALPGKNVYSVEADDLKIVYGIETTKQKIGYLKKMPECSVTLDANRIFNPHLFVVGKTGSGKSYFMKKYLVDLDENFWLFVPSNEYDSLLSVSKGEKMDDFVMELNVDNISYYANLNASEELILRSIDFEMDVVYSYREFVNGICEYYRKKRSEKSGQMTLDFGKNETKEVELPGYANSLMAKLRNIHHLKFVKRSKKLQLPNMSTVFDLGDYTQHEQECILNYYLYKLLQHLKKAKSQTRKKQIIIIEEAHNYVPSVKNTLSKDIIIRLSREGRKYGISLCFITQRPRFFDQTALSQSGNRIIFSLPNPDDVKHIMEDIPFYKPELALAIQSQKTGECIIAGDAYNDVLEVVIDS